MGRLSSWWGQIWCIEARSLSPLAAFCLKIVRVGLLAIREFFDDRVTLRASAMTFYSLLSLVPIAAFALGLAGLAQLDTDLVQAVYSAFPQQRVVIDQVLALSRSLLELTHTRLIALSALVVGGGSILKVLMHMDRSFSDIWGIHRLRSWWRRIIDYIALLLILPAFLLVSSGVTLFLSQELSWIEAQNSFLSHLGPLITALILFLPFFLVAALFTFLYLFVPNTRVRFLSALVGGLTAGLFYQVVQWGYIRFQKTVSHYDIVYGGLAALPLLLIWIELSWLILLVGAEISFAYQNTERYEFAKEAKRISRRMERLLTIYLLSELEKEGAATPLALARASTVPLCLVLDLLAELERTELARSNSKGLYTALEGVEGWTIKEIWDRLDTYGCDLVLPVVWEGALAQLRESLKELGQAIAHSSANVPLGDLGRSVSSEDSR